MDIIGVITKEMELQRWQVENTVKLIDEGNTIPFIARYRKEAHGTLDDQVLRTLSERLDYLRNLDKRRGEIISSIEEQEKMTPELMEKLEKAEILSELEDLYRPFKPKRRTRASVAKEKGLEPLANIITERKLNGKSLEAVAAEYIDPEKEVETAEDALQGASDIIAENISDNAELRKRLKNLFLNWAMITSKAAKEEESVYEQYYDFSESAGKIANHRILALDRGEREGFLKVKVEFDKEKALDIMNRVVINNDGSEAGNFMAAAGEDAYDRLLYPSVEREIRSILTDRAATDAIEVFAKNLHQLLLAPPVKNSVVLGMDPGYRMGCKLAVVDETGRVLATDVIQITQSERRKQEGAETVKRLINTYGVDVISIGNGTASKETEIFAADLIKEINREVSYMVVSEAGASVYSASKLAAEEFPEYDVNVRSAISIARRLEDPLAELVKIDPEAIGVGQYQHDMPKKQLEKALDGVVEDCVNSVGADLNTASPSLLSHIAGVSKSVSKNIVTYREENGSFTGRAQLKKVKGLGPKAFEQCAGFLRVPESRNVLDHTGVHPESYTAAKELLKLCGYDTKDVKAGNIGELSGKIKEMGYSETAEKLGIGVPTLKDIERELLLPGRDPRDELPPPLLRTDVMDIKDLKPDMVLQGTVRNVINFGAFVDIGVHQDGLVHISQLSDRFIKDPSEVVSVGDVVTVKIMEVDIKKQRIALTMKNVKQNK